MDPEVSKTLDASWFDDVELPGCWMRVVSCGPTFQSRMSWGWWLAQSGFLRDLGFRDQIEATSSFGNQ